MNEERVMIQFDHAEKSLKKQSLQMKIKDNIKTTLKIIFVGVVIVALINHQWQQFREEIHEDKSKIMNTNQLLLHDGLDSLEHMNSLMKALIYGVEPSSYLLESRFVYYHELESLTYFRYDYKSYQIETWELRDFFYKEREAIEFALQEEDLSERTKEGLAELILINQQILDDIQGITQKYIYQEKDQERKEAMEFVYFYQGEVFYLLANAMEVYGSQMNFSFIKDQPRINREENEKVNRTAGQVSIYYVKQINQLIYEDSFAFTSVKQNQSYEEGEIDDGQEVFIASDDSGDTATIYEHKNLEYMIKLTKEEIKGLPLLSMNEVGEIADQFIARIPMQDLSFENGYDIAVEVDDEFISDGYYFTYIVKTEDFFDETASINLRYHASGVLSSVYVGDLSILDGSYDIEAIKKDFISEEEALKAMLEGSLENMKSILLDVTSDPVYRVTVEEYNQEFQMVIDGITGELVSVE
jgi:hypothetical protein